MIVPLCAGSPLGDPSRRGARSRCCRISRSTRLPLTASPRWARRARTFRSPFPSNGVACKTPRIAASTAPSLTAVFGPRLLRAGAASRGAAAAYTLERATRHAWQSIVSG